MKPFENVSDLVAFIETSKRFILKSIWIKCIIYAIYLTIPKRFPSIHVTGTNGKSVVANLKAVFQAAEFRVGTFTSPYITCFNERIMINKAMISDEDLLKLGNRIIAKYDEMERQGKNCLLSSNLTLLAFLYFSERPDLD